MTKAEDIIWQYWPTGDFILIVNGVRFEGRIANEASGLPAVSDQHIEDTLRSMADAIRARTKDEDTQP